MKSQVLIYLFVPFLQGMTQAALVVGTSHVGDEFFGSNSFTIDQEFSSLDGFGRDFTGFFFDSLGGSNFEYGGSTLDEGVSVFFVDPNDAFSETNILGGEFIELTSGTTYTLPTNFFLGLRTPSLDLVGSVSNFAYGWAEIENLGVGELVLVDHAVTYGGSGIFVDTVTPIPEPRGLTLGLVAFALLLKRRTR